MATLNATDANRIPVGIREVSDLTEVGIGTSAKCGHLFFQNNPDHSRVFVFFNGEVPARLLGQGPTFQRWTWASDLANPVLCVSDASVDGSDDLQIGWYVANQIGGAFDDLMDVVEDVCARTAGKNAEIVCVGSSAGGFAALMAAIRNRCDGAVVFNPQVDVMRYRERAVSRFVARFSPDFTDPSAMWAERTSLMENIQLYSGRSKVIYWQNTEDRFHYLNHCKRIQGSIAKLPSDLRGKFSFNLYKDSQAGHNPPKREAFLAAIEAAYPGSIAVAAAEAAE